MTKQENQPICPKCGYDQSGEIATWESQCPVHGICPECGYEFAWIDVLNPIRIQLDWFVEHAMSRRGLLKRSHRTLWMMLIPNRYWRRVTMETPRSMKRHLLWVLLLMAILHALTTAAMVGARFGFNYYDYVSTRSVLAQVTDPTQRRLISSWMTDFSDFYYWLEVVGDSVLHPLIDRGYFNGESAIRYAVVALGCFGISLVWLIMFSAFPATRRRTKLRMIHVVRAVVVAGTVPILGIQLGRFSEALMLAGVYWPPLGEFITPISEELTSIWLMGAAIWLMWFWIAAVRVGWKVNAKWWELILVSFASLMGIVVAAWIGFAIGPFREYIDLFLYSYGI